MEMAFSYFNDIVSPIGSKQPKLLFLAYPFPPLSAVACIRTSTIAKYLARLGWKVTVVTPDPALWRHKENTQKTTDVLMREGIRRVLTGHGWRMLSPIDLKCWNEGLGWIVGGVCRKVARRLGADKAIGWIRATEKACSSLAPNDIDVILATAPPFSSFTLAKRLSDTLGCPYVLDYRDLWSRNAHHPMAAVTAKEAKLLAGCAAIVTVSPAWGSVMEREFNVAAKLHILSNGFDPGELKNVRGKSFGHFAIVYAGNFYPPKRVISPVMAALQILKTTNNRVQWYFHYYGNDEFHVREEACRFNVTDKTVIHGRVAWTESLSAIKGADIAVVVTSVEDDPSPENKGIVTGKIFEILGLGTRFLLIGPPDSDASIIATNTGLGQSFSGKDVRGIAAFLFRAMYGDAPRPRSVDSYSWEVIARQLDVILREAIDVQVRRKSAV
jgi:glycosyltransferase involved in cell wall biosynthesis